MSTVLIAEKPSQARDIAKVIGVKSTHEGYVTLVNGWKVTHAVGHLLELAEPQEYNEAWGGRWSWDQLPMVPPAFKRVPVKDRAKQLRIIKSLLADADTCIIATDAGREGELIGREILEHAKFKGKVLRFWTSALTPADIKKALDNLKPGSETYPLYEAAEARSHSDWLLGIPGTRGASLAARVRGDYFPLGRVKTPTLALLVRRQEAIDKFGAKKYYEIEARVRTAKGAEFKMMHSPAEDARITDKKKAQELLEQASKASAPLRVTKTKESEGAPLPYSLPQLQKEANRMFGFSAKRTLELAQILYEQKKVLSYPRTDCSYLSTTQIPEVESTLDAVAALFPDKVAQLRKLGVLKRSSTFNDAKLTDHHAIVPTGAKATLEGPELQLYTMVAHRYMQVLAPDLVYYSTRVTMDANGVPFKASGRAVIAPGWTSFKLSSKDDSAEEVDA